MKSEAVLYIRVSTEEQSINGVSLKDQEEKLLSYCKLNGLEAVHILREKGVSASKPLASRIGGQKMLQLVNKGAVKNVIALKLDRLFRNAADALNVTQKWDEDGVSLHLIDMGGQTINTATAMGRFFLSMMASFAELERNLISERTKAAMAYKRSHREPYGPPPYGFKQEENKLIEDKHEMEIIRRIKKWREEGQTLWQIVNRLNKNNFPTKRGGKWAPSTVKYLLENNLYGEVV